MAKKNKNDLMVPVLIAIGGIGLYLYLKKGSPSPSAMVTDSSTTITKASAVAALSPLITGDNGRFLAALNALTADQAIALYIWNANGRPNEAITPGSPLQAALRSFHNNGDYFLSPSTLPYI